MPTATWRVWECASKLYTLVFKMILRMQSHPISIMDARQRELDYDRCGFTKLDVKNAVADWDDEAELAAYKAEIEEHLQRLHPGVKRFAWTGFLKRGGPGNNPPAVNGPHLDFYQDRSQAEAFRGPPSEEDTEKYKEDPMVKDFELFGQAPIVVGVWKPVMMPNPVHDYPLCVMDAASFQEDEQVRSEQEFYHIDQRGDYSKVKNLGAAPHYSEAQRWYYYSHMTNTEALLFRHYTEDKFFCNVHSAVKHEELPAGAETRRSIESRVGLLFD